MEGKMSQQLQILIALLCIGAAFACRGGTIIHSGVTEQEKAIILEAHNKLRATVAMGRVPGQPGAENMMEVVWDDELAKHAQRWANECTFKHDPQRTIDRFIMGQNMAIIWSTAELEEDDGDFPSRVQNWFNEVKKYAFGDSWSPKTGHYSQLVWGETNLVGCGFSYYKTASKYNKLYVCNYGPGGNVVGSNPYEVGSPACTSYGMKPSSHYQGLCSAKVSGSHHNQVVNTFTYKSESYNTKNTYSAQHQNPNQQPQQQQLQKAQKQSPLKNYNLSPVSEDQKLRFQQQFHSTFRQQQQQQQQQQQLLQQQQQHQQKLLQQQTQQQQPQQQTVTKHLSASHFAYDWDARFQNNFRR